MDNPRALATSALAVVTAIFAASSVTEAKDCPANARSASLALWAGGTIPTGKTVSGTQPCGRQLTCIGGAPGNFASRECHWQ
jgi:hypothetical protein